MSSPKYQNAAQVINYARIHTGEIPEAQINFLAGMVVGLSKDISKGFVRCGASEKEPKAAKPTPKGLLGSELLLPDDGKE